MSHGYHCDDIDLVRDIEWSSDAGYVAFTGSGGTCVVDVKAHRARGARGSTFLNWEPGSHRFAAVSYSVPLKSALNVIDAEDMQLVARRREHGRESGILGAAYSSDGQWIARVASTRPVEIFRSDTLEPIKLEQARENPLTALKNKCTRGLGAQWRPGTHELFVLEECGYSDSHLLSWLQVDDRFMVGYQEYHGQSFWDFADPPPWAPQGTSFVVLEPSSDFEWREVDAVRMLDFSDGKTSVMNAKTPLKAKAPDVERSPAWHVTWNETGELVAVNNSATVAVIRASTGDIILEDPEGVHADGSMAWLDAYHLLAFSREDKHVWALNVLDGTKIGHLHNVSVGRYVRLSPDKRYLSMNAPAESSSPNEGVGSRSVQQIVRLSDGKIVASARVWNDGGPNGVWAPDSSAVAYSDLHGIRVLTLP